MGSVSVHSKGVKFAVWVGAARPIKRGILSGTDATAACEFTCGPGKLGGRQRGVRDGKSEAERRRISALEDCRGCQELRKTSRLSTGSQGAAEDRMQLRQLLVQIYIDNCQKSVNTIIVILFERFRF